MNKEELEELKLEVGRLYDEFLQDTEKRGISYGEIAYIGSLTQEKTQEMYDELLDYFSNKELAEIDIEKLIVGLDDLCKRLQDDYNNEIPFEQTEEDRLVVYHAIELLEHFNKKEGETTEDEQ